MVNLWNLIIFTFFSNPSALVVSVLHHFAKKKKLKEKKSECQIAKLLKKKGFNYEECDK